MEADNDDIDYLDCVLPMAHLRFHTLLGEPRTVCLAEARVICYQGFSK